MKTRKQTRKRSHRSRSTTPQTRKLCQTETLSLISGPLVHRESTKATNSHLCRKETLSHQPESLEHR